MIILNTMVMDELECIHKSKYDDWKILNIYRNTKNIDKTIEKFILQLSIKQNFDYDECKKFSFNHIKELIEENRTVLNLLKSQNITNISSEFLYKWLDNSEHSDDEYGFFTDDDYNGRFRDPKTGFYYESHSYYKYPEQIKKIYRLDWYLVVVWKGDNFELKDEIVEENKK
jgi:hypothetical protein